MEPSDRRNTKIKHTNRKNQTFDMLLNVFYFLPFVYIFNLIIISTPGLRNVNSRRTVFNLIKQQKYDISFLQETHWTDYLRPEVLREWGGDIIFNNFEPNARGTSIFFHLLFDYRNHHNVRDLQGRTFNAVNKVNLINIYAPTTDLECRHYFATISNFPSITDDNILGGDFNCILDNKIDKFGGNPYARQTATTFLHTIMQQYNMTDIWRDRNRNTRKFTWTGKTSHDNRYIHTRINRFYISSTLSNHVTNKHIIPFSFSDHDLISLTFDFNTQPRGEGYRLSNNNLLEDDRFNARVNHFWFKWLSKKNEFTTPLHWWDAAKYRF